MTNRAPKPAGMSWVIPYLMVADSGKAAQFYANNFGFEILSSAPCEDGSIYHAEMRYKDVVIMCGNGSFGPDLIKTPAEGKFKSPLCLYLYHENVDVLYETLIANNIPIEAPPEDQPWGDRTLRLTDPDGHSWSFSTNVADHV